MTSIYVMDHFDILNRDHLDNTAWGKELTNKFGFELASQFVDFLKEHGFTFELPINPIDIKLTNAPKVEVKFLDRKGNPFNSSEYEKDVVEVAKVHNFVVEINDQPQPYLRSIEIPPLDYSNDDILTFKLQYYAVVDTVKNI